MDIDLFSARRFLRIHFPEGGRVLCAVSGGLDSMCLLHFLTTWGPGRGFCAAAAHFNHGLRGQAADRDQQFVATGALSRASPASPAPGIPGG